MKVLFQSRTNLFTVFGGDTIQLLKTKEYLEKLGIEVDISTELTPDLTGYDILHLFNLARPQETWLQIKNAKKQGKPVALSTIYMSYQEYDRKARQGIARYVAKALTKYQIEYLKIVARIVKNREFNKGILSLIFLGYKRTQKRICKEIDIFLPNSESEMQQVVKDFPLKNYLYKVVPNAVDLNLFNYEKTEIPKEYQYLKDCVLCVARIDGNKNQLNVIKALNNAPYKVVFIGKPAPNHVKYYEEMKKIAADNIIFFPHMDHEKLSIFYKLAKVHILASWVETTGLSTLEAGVMNCNVVITKKGCTYDYFGEQAFYCEPDNIKSIREQTDLAYQSQFKNELKKLIIENYNWEKAAEATLEGYRSIYKKI